MNRKEYILKKVFFGTIFVVILFTLSILTFLFLKKKPEPISKKIGSSKDVTSISYIVKDFKGNVAVFEKNSENHPFKVTKVFTKRLPRKDQLILKNGIEVENQNELNSLLEDLCS